MKKQLEVNGISITVEKKKIKNLYLRVQPPFGEVRLTAPMYATDRELRAFVEAKMDWLERARAKYREAAEQGIPEYLPGEKHYLWGKSYPLEVVFSVQRPCVRLEEERIVLSVPMDFSAGQREKVMLEWYREQLKQAASPLMEKYTAIVGKTPLEWRVKNMKTRWGTCNVVDKRIWLNLQLAKKPPECLEYVIVHELVHLYERGHNKRFWSYVERFYPDWREVRKKLNRS